MSARGSTRRPGARPGSFAAASLAGLVAALALALTLAQQRAVSDLRRIEAETLLEGSHQAAAAEIRAFEGQMLARLRLLARALEATGDGARQAFALAADHVLQAQPELMALGFAQRRVGASEGEDRAVVEQLLIAERALALFDGGAGAQLGRDLMASWRHELHQADLGPRLVWRGLVPGQALLLLPVGQPPALRGHLLASLDIVQIERRLAPAATGPVRLRLVDPASDGVPPWLSPLPDEAGEPRVVPLPLFGRPMQLLATSPASALLAPRPPLVKLLAVLTPLAGLLAAGLCLMLVQRLAAARRQALDTERDVEQALERARQGEFLAVVAARDAALGRLLPGLGRLLRVSPERDPARLLDAARRLLAAIPVWARLDPAQRQSWTLAAARLHRHLQQIPSAYGGGAALLAGLDALAEIVEQQPAEVPLERLLQALLALAPALPGAPRVRRQGPALPDIPGDAGQIAQLLLALLLNAAQAMARADMADPEIGVVVHADTEQVFVRVVDAGPGIPESELPRLYEPFYSTLAGGQGAGLGLTVARWIVDRHDGRMNLQSAPGQGTTVHVALPRQERAGRRRAEPPGHGAAVRPAP